MASGKAIVAHSVEDWKLQDLKAKEPGDGELLVRMVAAGICHTDLVEVGQHWPCVLGHEGSGVVEKVGSNVTVAQVGDPVLLSYAYCGKCHYCKIDHPAYCQNFAPLNFFADQPDYALASDSGKQVSGSFFGQSSFASHAIVRQNSVVNAKNIVKSDEELKLFAPLGCGIQTGSGSVLRIAKATKDDIVAVLGLGSVGLAGIMGAHMAGCKQIIAIDIIDSRIEMAKSLGATHGINSKKLPEGKSLVDHVRELVDGLGPTISLDTTGVLPLIQQAQEFTRPMGKMVQVAAAAMDAMMQVHVVSHVVFNKQLMGGIEGDSIASRAVPEMVEWYRKGSFPFDRLVKFYKAEEFEKAVKAMKVGETIKPVLVW